jgi:hypothetical protein
LIRKILALALNARGFEGYIFVEIRRVLWKCDLGERAAQDRADRFSRVSSEDAQEMVR